MKNRKMTHLEGLRAAIVLAVLDRLKPWTESKDLEHCWESFPYQQKAYRSGRCEGELQLWEGMESSWIGHFIIHCRKHAQDKDFRQAWKQRYPKET